MNTERTASILGGLSSNSISLAYFLSSRERVIKTEVSTQAFNTKLKNNFKILKQLYKEPDRTLWRRV